MNHRGDINGFPYNGIGFTDLTDWRLQIGDLGGNRPTDWTGLTDRRLTYSTILQSSQATDIET